MPLEGKLSSRLTKNLDCLKEFMGIGESFDLLLRRLRFAEKEAAIIWVDGLINDLVLQRIIESLFGLEPGELSPNPAQRLMKEALNYAEATTVDNYDDLAAEVLSGQVAILVDGDDEAVIADVRQYPARSPDEPDLERVIRGSRDGMIETLIHNTVLIRRRIRDPSLRVEAIRIGVRSKTDVALLYLKDVANLDLVKQVRDKLNAIEIDAIPMAEKTVEEFLTGPFGWWNPFPQVRFTERPDVAAVHLLEGHVVVAVDTSPSVILLPATLFHHIQHAEEYRENTLVGTYIRLVRIIGIFLSLVVPPIWVALVLKTNLPKSLDFIGPKTPGNIPLLVQFLIAEYGVDLIRIALIHTPNALATALGFIGAILLGQIAVTVGLLASETILYVTLATLGTFSTPSMELAMAIRLFRIVLLILGGLTGLWGIGAGLIALGIVLGFTRSFGIPYLWPLIPFDFAALKSVLIRRPIPADTGRPSALKPQDRDKRPGKRR